MKILPFLGIALLGFGFYACTPNTGGEQGTEPADTAVVAEDDFQVQTEQFADIRILRYQIPGFEELDLKTKELLYYLSQAGYVGRDIFYDQNYRHNLCIRRTLEAIVTTYEGDQAAEEYGKFMEYAKRVWFSNGIHHHYSTKKFEPGFTAEYFAALVQGSDVNALPLEEGETAEALIAKLSPILFDPNIDAKRVNLDADADPIANSANNYYGVGVTAAEAEKFYAAKKNADENRPISHGLNLN